MTHAICSIFMFLLLVPMSAARADAASMEVLAGGGTADSEDSSADFYQVRINIIHPLMQRLDAFAGLEYAQSEQAEADEFSYKSNSGRFSFKFPAAAFGLRFKPVAREKFQLYLALGGVAGKVYYRTNFAGSDQTLLSRDQDAAYFVVARLELGANLRIGERTALIAQVGTTGPLPTFHAVTVNRATGAVGEQELNDRGYMAGFMLGLRYKY